MFHSCQKYEDEFSLHDNQHFFAYKLLLSSNKRSLTLRVEENKEAHNITIDVVETKYLNSVISIIVCSSLNLNNAWINFHISSVKRKWLSSKFILFPSRRETCKKLEKVKDLPAF